MRASRRDEINLNLVIFGHCNAGKATIAQYLFNNLGHPENETVNRTEHISANKDGTFTNSARILDDLQAEKEKYNDSRPSPLRFRTSRYTVTVVDVPGHRNFIKNLVTGTSFAKYGLIIVAADTFRSGTAQYEEIHDQVHLANSLGTQQLIFLLNKMDNVEWNESQYRQVQSLIGAVVTDTRYKSEDITCVPTCGFAGDNLISESACTPWYTTEVNKIKTNGLSLCEAIDRLASSQSTPVRPLRLPVRDVYKVAGIGIVPVGRIESGVLRTGMVLKFASSLSFVRVKSLEMPKWAEADAGNTVGFSLVGLPFQEIRRGDVAGNAHDTPPYQIRMFGAQIVVIGQTSIRTGSTVTLECHTVRTTCKVSQLEFKVDRRTGRYMEANPHVLNDGDVGIVRLISAGPICVELFADFPTLGRIIMYSLEARIAVGIIVSVENPKACDES